MRSTHPGNISGPELNCSKQAKDDDDNVEKVGQDGSPLVAQEVDHLTLQHADLGGGGLGGGGGGKKKKRNSQRQTTG